MNNDSKHNHECQSEEQRSCLLTKIFYFWAGDAIRQGWARCQANEALTNDDLLTPPLERSARSIRSRFQASWARETRRAKVANVPPSIIRALFVEFGWPIIVGGVFRVLADGSLLALPLLLRGLLSFLTQWVRDADPAGKAVGFGWAIGLALCVFFQSTCHGACLLYSGFGFQLMREATTIAIFEKTLRLEANHGLGGKITLMHSTDTSKLVDVGNYFHSIFTTPFLVVAAIIELYFFIGWAGVISIGVIFLFVPFQLALGKKMMMARVAISHIADRRMKVLNELLQGIRVVKFMCWEKQFQQHIQAIRSEEATEINHIYVTRSLLMMFGVSSPIVVAFGVFTVAYAFVGYLDAESVFPAMTTLAILRMPIGILPFALGRLVDAASSLQRISEFLCVPEREEYLQHVENSSDAILMNNASLQCYNAHDRTQRQTLLANITLVVPKGKLTIIIGPTGSGKSTLLIGMAGQSLLAPSDEPIGHGVMVSGSIAFVTQEPWSMNTSLRENILMGAAFEESRYKEIITKCQLMADLEQLPGSDMTEIGERGINISGGQKQRIALARAAYSRRDIILLDDPLSAVDVHVSQSLWKECILGLLHDKTRVLVTTQVQFLPEADKIIVMDKNRIIFQGSYGELRRSNIIEFSADTNCASSSVHPNATPDSEIPSTFIPDTMPHPRREFGTTSLMSTENPSQGNLKLATLAWYARLAGVGNMVRVLILFLVWRAFMALGDLTLAWWTTRAPILDKNLTDHQYITWYGIWVVLSVVFILIRQIPFVSAMANASSGAHDELILCILRAPSSFFDTTPVGRLLNRCSKDVENVDLGIPEQLNMLFNMGLILLGSLVIMCCGAPYLSIAVVLMFAAYGILLKYFTATNRAQKRLESINRSPCIAIMNETLGGLPTIRAYAMIDTFCEEHLLRINVATRATYSLSVSQRWINSRVDMLSFFVVFCSAFIIVALIITYSKADQRSNLPVMALALSYMVSIAGGLSWFTQLAVELEAAFSSVERIKEYATELPQESDVIYGNEIDSFPPPRPTWPENGHIAFSHVSCRYREGLPLVLNDINFDVPAGSKIGIVGRTGSGKSTIMLTLFRMLEISSGRIEIDGHDISQLKMDDLRSKIVIIPQDPLLFEGTIRVNMDPFNGHTDEEIWEVLEKVSIADRVRQDKKGLLSIISERGSNYSAGQRQLLCLARSLLKKCKVLLLDEATASVDRETDCQIQETVRREFRACTVLTIAHRLATIIDSDKVLVLENGVVRDFDTPAVLLNNSRSVFFSMVKDLGDEGFRRLKAEADTIAAQLNEKRGD